jgi:hypothetical protein
MKNIFLEEQARRRTWSAPRFAWYHDRTLGTIDIISQKHAYSTADVQLTKYVTYAFMARKESLVISNN